MYNHWYSIVYSVSFLQFSSKTLSLGIRGENPQFLTNLQNVEDKCLYKMQTVLKQYLNRKLELFGL